MNRRIVRFGAVLSLLAFAAPAWPEKAPPPPTAATRLVTRLVLLGTAAGPVPRALRSQPANLVQVGERNYLVDAGEGVVRQLAALGLQPRNIDTVFLTHLHMDHVAGLAPLIGMRWVARARGQITVYGPAGTAKLVEGALDSMAEPEALSVAEMPPGPRMAKTVRAVDEQGDGPVVWFQDDRVRVTAVANSHYQTIAPALLPPGARSYALRFDTPDRTIVFTGDSGPSDAIAKLAKGADILVSEVIDLPATMAFVARQYHVAPAAMAPQVRHMSEEHLTPEEIGKIANRAGVKMVVLTHFAPGLDTETDMRTYTAGVRVFFKGPVVAGRDLDEF